MTTPTTKTFTASPNQRVVATRDLRECGYVAVPAGTAGTVRVIDDGGFACDVIFDNGVYFGLFSVYLAAA